MLAVRDERLGQPADALANDLTIRKQPPEFAGRQQPNRRGIPSSVGIDRSSRGPSERPSRQEPRAHVDRQELETRKPHVRLNWEVAVRRPYEVPRGDTSHFGGHPLLVA